MDNQKQDSNLNPQLSFKSGEASMELTLHVTRKDTGLTETYQLKSIPEPQTKEQ